MVTQPNYEESLTVEDYFRLDESSDIKYEYINGQIYAMSGGTPNHSRIINNITGLMFIALRGSSCGGYNSDIRVQISKEKYVYPNFTVVCGESEFSADDSNNLLNPTMVVEVISESSEHRDRFIKLDLYRRIPSIKIYLIVEQDQARATLLTRQEDGWFLRLYSGLDAIVPLDDIQASLKLSELYETVEFPDGQSDAGNVY